MKTSWKTSSASCERQPKALDADRVDVAREPLDERVPGRAVSLAAAPDELVHRSTRRASAPLCDLTAPAGTRPLRAKDAIRETHSGRMLAHLAESRQRPVGLPRRSRWQPAAARLRAGRPLAAARGGALAARRRDRAEPPSPRPLRRPVRLAVGAARGPGTWGGSARSSGFRGGDRGELDRLRTGRPVRAGVRAQRVRGRTSRSRPPASRSGPAGCRITASAPSR